MSITTVSGQEFNRDSSGARRAAQNGPVFITDRGRPAHVLLTMDDYQRLAGPHKDIASLLAMSSPDIDFEPQPVQPVFKPADLS